MECLRKPAGRKTNILPDLIVLDLDLPGDTSLTLLRELRRDSRLATLPVIVMAWSDEQSIVLCLGGLGVVGYVVKPLRFDEVVALVGGVCRHGLSGNSHQEFCVLGSETSSMTILLLGFRRLFDQERQQLLKKQDVKSCTEVPKVVGIGQFGTGASSFVRPGHHAIIHNSDGRAGSRRGRDTITIVS
ncbi:MAG: response regulator [Nitrospirae bacterium]|nr:response regulator [Nitrospirota bacterium]